MFCPSCGKAGIEGMKFCPQCGQSLIGSNLEEKKRHVPKPEVPSKKSSWFERHLNWTLVLGIIGGPFLLFWIVFGVVNLILLFSPNVAAWIGVVCIRSAPFAFIAIIVLMVQWYKKKKKQNTTI